MLFDTHAHLETVNDLEILLDRAKETEVGKIITIGTSLESSKKAIEIAEKFSGDDLQIYATSGLHPKDAKGELEKQSLNQCIDTLKQIAKSSDKVVGVGEAGLDYYPDTNDEDKNFQRKLFEAQINLATELSLPLIIHCRNAWEEILSLLSTDYRLRTKLTGVFHSFTGDWQAAQKALDLGFYISFSGIVTFKNAADLKEVAKKMPLERMLLETDSPFLSPEPFRGKQNEPKNVKIIAEFLAHLRSQPINKIIGASAENAKTLFEK